MVDSNATAGAGAFYIYDDRMLQHRDTNYHNESDGKMKTDLPEARVHDFISPEVPFRIQAIHQFLSSFPTEAPLLPQM